MFTFSDGYKKIARQRYEKIRNYPSPAAIFPVGSCGRGVSSPRRSVAAGGIFGEPFHFTAESATFVVHGKAGIQLARSSGFAAGSQTALARRIASLLRRAAALYHRTVRGQPRPSGVEPRCGGAGCGDPLRFRHARRPAGVGRRPSGLCAQDHHGAPRGVPHQPQAGGHQRLSAHRRESLRRFRRGPFVGLDLGRFRYGQGRRAARREAAGDRRDRRRRHDGRLGFRGDEQRRAARPTCWSFSTTTTWLSTRLPAP